MKRSEHLEWCKQRANEYIESGDLKGAFASFMSDMRKHDETSDHLALELGITLMFSGHLDMPNQMKDWIDGFN